MFDCIVLTIIDFDTSELPTNEGYILGNCILKGGIGFITIYLRSIIEYCKMNENEAFDYVLSTIHHEILHTVIENVGVISLEHNELLTRKLEKYIYPNIGAYL